MGKAIYQTLLGFDKISCSHFSEKNLRSLSEGAAEGGCGGNSAAPERSAERSEAVSSVQNRFGFGHIIPHISNNLYLNLNFLPQVPMPVADMMLNIECLTCILQL